MALRLRRMPLFAKLLIPLLSVTVVLGTFGVFLVVRDLSARARSSLEQDLARRSLDARSLLRDRELYLLESVNLAANLQGMTEAVRGDDRDAVARLMQSVLALKTDLDFLVITDRSGTGMAEVTRTSPASEADRRGGRPWANEVVVAGALRATTTGRTPGYLNVSGRPVLVVAAPVCTQAKGCAATGAAVAGIGVDRLATSLTETPSSGVPDAQPGIAIYDADGRLLATVGPAAAVPRAPALPPGGQIRQTQSRGGEEIATIYSPVELGGQRLGTLAVSVPTAPAFAAVRGARFRLALLLLATLVGAIAFGAMISRLILRQVRPLIETNRSLGRGELSARAPVLSEDELGELAQGINQMAEQLQAIYGNLELRVEQRTEEVRRLLRERTEFFAALSHELRTPLAVIVGQGRIILDPSVASDRRRTVAATRTIVDTAKHLISLVNEILELARAEAGRIEVDIETIDVSRLIRGLRPTIEGLTRGASLDLDVSVPRDLPEVRADRRRVREIVVNLVDNAVKYTPAGGKIAVDAATNNGTIEISVRDTGIGIPAETGDLIFEPFYRVKDSEAQAGQASTGLGLALSKRLVEAQGGRIWYSSDEQGTTFTFSLPRPEERAGSGGRGRRKTGAQT